WDDFFDFKINMGKYHSNSFDYFLRLSTCKPRDFVKLLKICKEQCLSANKNNPDSEIITSDLFRKAYSTYYADTLRTALSFYYSPDQIKLIFNFIKAFKRCRFTYKQYLIIWDNFADKESLNKLFDDSFDFLEFMFNFNIIGLVEKKNYYRWKYRECSIANYDYSIEKNLLNDDSQFIFHTAAEKEFGLYL
ncbi:MAG: hypothetical protein IK072_02830, partial [Clostridia bacterium]|nr:hypothetical protein [Clostridia bacterium]